MMRRFVKHKFLFTSVFISICVFFIPVFVVGIDSPLRVDTTFVVNSGESIAGVANRLKRQNIINSTDLFMGVVRYNGAMVQRGEYEIPRGASVWRVGRMLARGKIATTTITVPEGLTLQQIRILLQNTKTLSGPSECNVNDGRPVCNLRDGDVFPDTYRVARGTSRLAVLELMRKKMVEMRDAWTRTGAFRPSPLKNWNDIVTLASIVQKETARTREMPLVAGVYLNRLRINMRLQADPTVVYVITNGSGDMGGAPLLSSHLKVDSPYNTYRNAGLPPAPIANVGAHAIRAVLKPANTDYLFFVADGRGGHRFSKTFDEHKKNHNQWREIKRSRM